MTVKIAIVGAGLVGSRHAEAISQSASAQLASVTDPSDVGDKIAAQYGVSRYASLDEMLVADKPDGVILATPNQLHVEGTLACIDAGIPTLIEKPLADTLDGARTIAEAGKASGVPLLTGHHRRHNPLIAKAKQVVESGDLGTITSAHGMTWLYKPDDYFDVDWRRKKGAGPVYINLIHDIDMLRHLCGEIASVHAMESNAVRNNEVEDTAAILLKFNSGALGTINLSDTIVAPYSWELTARENPAYPATTQDCYLIGGTNGTLSLPNLTVWSNPGKKSWWDPIAATKLPFGFEDPLVCQIRHFAAVISGDEEPLVSALEGYKNQQIIEAVKQSASCGNTIHIS